MSPSDPRPAPSPTTLRSRARPALLATLLGLAILLAGMPALASADEPGAAAPVAAASHADSPSPGWAIAIGLAVLLSVVGLGCAIAVMGALFPRLSAAMDRQARGGSTGAAYVYGSLVLLGVLAAVAGLGHGHPRLGGGVALVLGLPALLLLLAGSLGTLPLLGERVLGARGASASPLARSVTASLCLGLAFLPGAVLRLYPIAFLVALAATGWPLGVGIAALLARVKPRATPPAPPAPSA